MQMKIKVDSRIEILEPNKEIIDYCKDFLTLKNPEIQKKKAMRILDWKSSKKYKNVFFKWE